MILAYPAALAAQPAWQPPVSPACVSSPFGMRHAVGPHAPAGFHNGVDLPAPAGALVHAAAAGTVVAIRRQGLGGVTVHTSPMPAASPRCMPISATWCLRSPKAAALSPPASR